MTAKAPSRRFFTALLEFVGADGEARLCDELAVGESYALVVTTASGLYRYAIGDVVECVAIEGAAPRLRFAGRAGVTSDLVGEKLTEAFAASALAGLPCPAQLAARADPPGYVLLLDSDDAQAAALAAPVEARLCDNPQYAYARKLGQLAPLGVEPRPGLAAQAIHRGLAAGQQSAISSRWRCCRCAAADRRRYREHPVKIALVSPKGPLYRNRGGIFRKSLRYQPLTLTTLAALVPPELEPEFALYDEGTRDVRSTSTPISSA